MPDDGLVTATRRATEGEARSAAVHLVEHGIGATVLRLPPPPGQSEVEAAPWAVQVLEADHARAEELLGVGSAATGSSPTPAGPGATPGSDDVQAEASGAGSGGAVGGPVSSGGRTIDTERGAEDDVRASRPPVPWKRILLIWLVAMIVLPLVAGLLTYLVLSR